MNNLHRELAPISDTAWKQIEEEASRTLKRHLAARHVVDVLGPFGLAFPAVGTGHIRPIDPPSAAVAATAREVRPLVEFRVPFELSRQEIDAVARGAQDSDWGPLKEAARTIAFAEDRAVFEGYGAGEIGGLRQGSDNPVLTLPADAKDYPDVVARALGQLRLAGVQGPYALVLGAAPYTLLSGARDGGCSVLGHVRRLLDRDIVWAPAIAGGVALSVRGGDFALHLGQDISIGYLDHSATAVRLYFEESFTFLSFTAEASVPLASPTP